jgi:transcriptional regulator with XRE-family HTH domain
VATEEGALTMNDVGYYMRALRMIQNVSLAKMRKRMGGILSVPRMSTMERGEVQSMGLMQALEWATALQEVNQIFKAFWLATEVGVVVADVASEREAAARRKAAETIVTLWRWEQVLFASPDWVTDFRRVVDESADESA